MLDYNAMGKRQQQPKRGAPNGGVKGDSERGGIVGRPWSQIQAHIEPALLRSLEGNGWGTMFPVQQATIPLMLTKNYDLAVEAQTGSGKTLAFVVPLLQKLMGSARTEASQRVRFLLISPTRELSQQSYSVLGRLMSQMGEEGERLRAMCQCVTGGSELDDDLARVQGGVTLLLGTVGRLRELALQMEEGWLKKVDYLVIDEADRVLKEKGIEQLVRRVQKLRRTAMFSATLQGMLPSHFEFYGMRNLAKISLKAIEPPSSEPPQQGPVAESEPKGYVIPKNLNNTYLVMQDRMHKIAFLWAYLQLKFNSNKIIVFVSTCACVDFYCKILQRHFAGQAPISGIHGKLKPRRRQRIIEEFLGRKSGVLVATDVVSRGIDFENVELIVQVDPPEDPDNYVHRIGRTARVNRTGTAVLLIEPHEEAFISYLGQKGVGVKRVEGNEMLGREVEAEGRVLQERMLEVMAEDRDNIEKSRKAFVSYVRAYKEHDLRFIFEFKHLDIGKVARSFFLFRIPRIKEILGKSIESFENHPIDPNQVPWLDKNQQAQFRLKESKREEQRQVRKSSKPVADIKNIKSRRKKVRRRNEAREMEQMNQEHRAIMKGRRGKQAEREEDSDSGDDDEDTEQLEQRIAQKYSRH